MAIGILTGSGTYALPGLRGHRAASRSTRRGARRSSRAGRGRASRCCTSRATAPGHPRLSNHVTHRANIAALKSLGATGVLAVTVCGAVDPSVELGSLVCFDDLHFLVQPAARRLAVHVLHRAGRARARPLDLRGPVLAGPARARCSRARREAGVAVRDGGCYGHVDGPRFNTARRDPRARRRAASPPSRRPPGRRPCCAARLELPVRAARLPDRLRQRRQGRGDAGRRRWSR